VRARSVGGGVTRPVVGELHGLDDHPLTDGVGHVGAHHQGAAEPVGALVVVPPSDRTSRVTSWPYVESLTSAAPQSRSPCCWDVAAGVRGGVEDDCAVGGPGEGLLGVLAVRVRAISP
jgi:hypothetical protein